MASTRLFVAGIPYETKDDQLAAHFAPAGQVTSAKVITDRYSGRSKGFGFVEMATAEEAAKAVETLNGSTLGGRQLVVKEAYPMKDRNDNGGGRRDDRRNDFDDRG
ncbi:MAG TPA: RNA-binding protein [Patescibacteria group bacterium]|nr:RNA-binding protein [Patescibacteria group bacterium]